jgi:hypothetical protein
MRFNMPFCRHVTALILTLLFGTGLLQPVAAGESPSAVMETSEETVATDVATQEAVDEWAAEEKALLEKIDRHEQALKRIAWERKKNEAYMVTLEAKVVELREKSEEMKRINTELLPILDHAMERLTIFVQNDIPFDKTRRLQQAEDATRILNDYDANLLVKTRTLFDAVAREVDVGYSVDVKETEIEIDNRSIRVKLLKVGRVGLYALAMDAEKAYIWDAGQKTYLPVEGGVREIDEAVQMVEGIRIIELTRLPVGRPVKAAPGGGAGHE